MESVTRFEGRYIVVTADELGATLRTNGFCLCGLAKMARLNACCGDVFTWLF
jgi:hypothetical protein